MSMEPGMKQVTNLSSWDDVRPIIPEIQRMAKTGMMNNVHRVIVDALRRNW